MPRGGARKGAGRPKGRGKYGEATRPLRIPESMVSEVLGFVESKGYQIPLYSSKVQAGFPSPADDFIEGQLNLNEHLIKHPAATFFVRVSGDSMTGAGIHDGDILVVDRSLNPAAGKIVVAAVDGMLTVKRFENRGGKARLLPENPDFKPIEITEFSDVIIWGVVTSVVHEL